MGVTEIWTAWLKAKSTKIAVANRRTLSGQAEGLYPPRTEQLEEYKIWRSQLATPCLT